MKTPQQQIETKIEGVAFMLSAIYGGSMLQQKDSARQILFNNGLGIIDMTVLTDPSTSRSEILDAIIPLRDPLKLEVWLCPECHRKFHKTLKEME